MSNHDALIEELRSSGYSSRVMATARYARDNGLGAETTRALLAEVDSTAATVAGAFLGNGPDRITAAQQTPEQRFNDDLRAAVGFPTERQEA
jgi:hypothetical protein